MKSGQIIIDAIIRAAAIQSAEHPTPDSTIFVWHANAAEQIEAALAEAGYELQQKDEAEKMLGMATDLNLDLQNRCDMWRDEFQRIKAIECSRPGVVESEIIGICDRAMLDIRSKISLIDQREKAADMIAKLNEEATATEELLRTYGWKEKESLQMFLHRTRMPANPLKHSLEYLAVLLQSCEEKLLQAGAALKAIFDATDPYADGAPDASAHDKLCNEISALARPWRRGYSENHMSNNTEDSIPAIESAILNICTACDDCYAVERAWLDANWDDCIMWINNAIAQLESARAKIKAHHES